MASESVTTSPSKPSSPRSQSLRTVALNPARRSDSAGGRALGAVICPTITSGAPAAMPAAKGVHSPLRSAASVFSVTAASSWLSWAVSPWPGKCLRQASTPASPSPSTAARTQAAAVCGSAENARLPMTGLSGLVFTSATGAKSSAKPKSRR